MRERERAHERDYMDYILHSGLYGHIMKTNPPLKQRVSNNATQGYKFLALYLLSEMLKRDSGSHCCCN